MCHKTIEKTLFPSVTIICLMPEERVRKTAQRTVAAIAILVRSFTIARPANSQRFPARSNSFMLRSISSRAESEEERIP